MLEEEMSRNEVDQSMQIVLEWVFSILYYEIRDIYEDVCVKMKSIVV